MQTATGHLVAAPPFDFAKSTEFLHDFAPTAGEQRLAALSVTRAIEVGGSPIGFRLESETGDPESPRLHLELFGHDPADEARVRAAEDRVAFFLSLGDDLRTFYEIGRADEHFAPVVRLLYGFHQVKFPTPFENAAWAILTQRNRLPGARRLKAALVERFGHAVDIEGERYASFPSPFDIVRAPMDALERVLDMPERAQRLRTAAEAFAEADEQWLRRGPYDRVLDWLLAIRGIGPWSASFIMIRGLGRMERLPLRDEHLLDAVARFYRPGHRVTPEQVAELAEPYGDLRGYWALYLRNAHAACPLGAV